jgi:arabinogalactan oligomer/maltooligosaccharide transport system permease protein
MSTQLSSPVRPGGTSHARSWSGRGAGFLVKLLLMALVNALGIAAVLAAWSAESWVVLGATVILTVAADIVYFTKRALPLKYLFPGLSFLLVFQIFVFGYTGYIAFTNYGTGHAGSMEQAVEAGRKQGLRPREGGAR